MSKEFKVGLFAIISGTILYLGFNFLKGKDFFSSTNKFYAIYKNIDGLNVSNPVIINGFAIGRVSAINILQKRNNHIIVEMDIKEDLILGDSTIARLINSDFMGSKAILLEVGDISRPINDGDTLVTNIDKGLAGLLESAQPITADLEVTIKRINEILLGMEGAGEGINNTIKSLNATLISVNKFIKQNNVKVQATFDGVNTLLANINSKVADLDPILANANTTLEKINDLPLDSAVTSLTATIQELNLIMSDINEGKGTVGKMLKEDSLYINMNQAILDLDKLLIHFNENPKHFMGPLGKSKKKIEKERKKAEGN